MSAYRDVTGVTEPTTVLTFWSSGDALLTLTHAGSPFHQPPWSPTVVGMVLNHDTDWDEVGELVTGSYRFRAPQTLRRQLHVAARSVGSDTVTQCMRRDRAGWGSRTGAPPGRPSRAGSASRGWRCAVLGG